MCYERFFPLYVCVRVCYFRCECNVWYEQLNPRHSKQLGGKLFKAEISRYEVYTKVKECCFCSCCSIFSVLLLLLPHTTAIKAEKE